MNFDKNTGIGFLLLMLLLFGYIYFTGKEQEAYQQAQKKEKGKSNDKGKEKPGTIDSALVGKNDSLSFQDTATIQPGTMIATNQPEKITIVENEWMKVSFTSKGGYPSAIELKNYQRFDKKPIILGGKGHRLSYPVNIAPGRTEETANMQFVLQPVKTTAEGQEIRYLLTGASTSIEHVFLIRKNDYLIDWKINLNGAGQLLTGGVLPMNWDIVCHQQERDLKYEKGQSNIGYVEDGSYDFDAAGTGDERKFGNKTKWIGVKQQFFNTTLIAPNEFSYAQADWLVPGSDADSLQQVLSAKNLVKFDLAGAASASVPLQIYYGPNDYHLLKKHGLNLENHVQLGYGIFAFVKYINRFVVMPVFDFFHKYIGSLGIVILLLTFFIRLIISPLTYTSYLSGAKMKVLRPEIDELKKKYGDDQQAMSMEQMKLFRQAGVNPLGGCIPALLQIPIFFALYSFFNSSLTLRGESFLWSQDLSAYDSIANLPFSIPAYGDHVSLFTITATATSFLISLYNTQMTPQQDNPVFKYMIYIFPIMLLFIFNSLPSGLTWYYTISNMVTLILQFVIQKFIINEKLIHAKIQENKKKPVTQSKWQQRIEQMQQSSQKMQDQQKKNKPGK